MPKMPSDRLVLRLPEKFRQFLAWQSERNGIGYSEVIRSAIMAHKDWADWQKSIIPKPPKPETAYERKQRTEKLLALSWYRDHQGHYKRPSEKAPRVTWIGYLSSIREVTQPYYIRDPEMFDTVLRETLERREAVYEAAGEDAPPLPPQLTKPRIERCPHGVPIERQYFECMECVYERDMSGEYKFDDDYVPENVTETTS
jgi:hypothetical protein